MHLRLQSSLARLLGSPQPEPPIRGIHLPAMGLPQCPSHTQSLVLQPGRAQTPRKHPGGFQSQQVGSLSVASPIVLEVCKALSCQINLLFPEISHLHLVFRSKSYEFFHMGWEIVELDLLFGAKAMMEQKTPGFTLLSREPKPISVGNCCTFSKFVG